MNQILLLLFTVCIIANFQGQEITKHWQLKEGWFPEQNLQFELTDEKETYNVFKFNADGTIDYLNELEEMSCPVGEFTMKEGHWELEDDNLTLTLRGLKISDFWYWWIVNYKVRLRRIK